MGAVAVYTCVKAVRGHVEAQAPRLSQPRKKPRQLRRDAVVVASENAEQTYFKESSKPDLRYGDCF